MKKYINYYNKQVTMVIKQKEARIPRLFYSDYFIKDIVP